MNDYLISGLLYFTGTLAFLFCIYYNAKLIKSVELKKEANFADFSSDFFLILFFPIGIWIIQPKLNKIIVNAESNSH